MIRLPPYQPATTRPVWDVSVTIRGVVIRYRLVWYPRRAAWYLTLWADGEEMISGRRVTAQAPDVAGGTLLWRYRLSPPLPMLVEAGGKRRYGRLMLYSFSGDSSEVTEAGLGWTHALYWIDPDDQTTAESIVIEVT